MIDHVMSMDQDYLFVNSPGTQLAYTSGAVYWDANIRQYKVVDQQGNSHPMGYSTVGISIGPKIAEMLSWYEQRLREEAQIQELCKKYPNLADAKREYDALFNLLKSQDY